FLPTFETEFIAAYFDPTGLYAFGRQPAVVHWNLARLADALAPLSPTSTLATARGGYEPLFRDTFRDAVLKRLGLEPRGPDEDAMLRCCQLRPPSPRPRAAWPSIASSSTGTAAPPATTAHGRARRPALRGRTLRSPPPPTRAIRPPSIPSGSPCPTSSARRRARC